MVVNSCIYLDWYCFSIHSEDFDNIHWYFLMPHKSVNYKSQFSWLFVSPSRDGMLLCRILLYLFFYHRALCNLNTKTIALNNGSFNKIVLFHNFLTSLWNDGEFWKIRLVCIWNSMHDKIMTSYMQIDPKLLEGFYDEKLLHKSVGNSRQVMGDFCVLK